MFQPHLASCQISHLSPWNDGRFPGDRSFSFDLSDFVRQDISGSGCHLNTYSFKTRIEHPQCDRYWNGARTTGNFAVRAAYRHVDLDFINPRSTELSVRMHNDFFTGHCYQNGVSL